MCSSHVDATDQQNLFSLLGSGEKSSCRALNRLKSLCFRETSNQVRCLCPQVPDYLEFISQPMDFSTMLSKLESHSYRSVADLESDFNLMVSNCLLYNTKDTVFHRAALRLRELGGAILRHAHRQATNTGLDQDTGMLLPESPQKRDFYSCTWEDGESH